MNHKILLSFWAKWSEAENTFHPLLYHMLDTSVVCRKIWDECLHDSAREWMSGQLEVCPDVAGDWISFWAGLHDIGKATPGFQGMVDPLRTSLDQACFSFEQGSGIYHGTATAAILPSLLNKRLNPELAEKVAVTVGGHHGVFPRSREINNTELHLGDNLWNETRLELFHLMTEFSGARELQAPSGKPSPAFFMFLAGLTSVSDWIASNEDLFPYDIRPSIEDYVKISKEKSSGALDRLGWTGWYPDNTRQSFNVLFDGFDPRPLQQITMQVAESLCNSPGLVIIEAPTGEGKTEAAMYLADAWLGTLGQKGIYFGLPTMATSNQMFRRVEKFLGKRFPEERVNIMLLHGHASLSDEFETLKNRFIPSAVHDDFSGSGDNLLSSGTVASEWFTYRKRGLLAPFGVGTVDQALLGVLQTKHVFVRLFGMAHKTIIIDEVHAYDAYMTTLLERLMEWLAALGSSVVLLSATLPAERSSALLQAYKRGLENGVTTSQHTEKTAYPRISWITGDRTDAVTVETSSCSHKELYTSSINGALPALNEQYELGVRLHAALRNGGCAAVICSTVDEAQKVYQALKPYFPERDAGDGLPELDLLHARFMYKDRQEREERCIKRFGKGNENRPGKVVLVATQIIEQSLDLDFDLMVSDIAPIDLLLQRAGRLHRHEVRVRPEGLCTAQLWLKKPTIGNKVPFFGGGTEAVYDYHILLRSWLALQPFIGKRPILVPDHVESLIESVYDSRECPGNLEPSLQKKWAESREKLEKSKSNYAQTAKGNRILPPFYEDDIMEDFNKELEEENPSIAPTLQALTRLSNVPSVSVICLFGDLSNPRVEPERLKLNVNDEVDIQSIKMLLKCSLQLSHQTLSRELLKQDADIPRSWKKEPLLRHHYLLFFDESGLCKTTFPGYQLILSAELGLVISRKST